MVAFVFQSCPKLETTQISIILWMSKHCDKAVEYNPTQHGNNSNNNKNLVKPNYWYALQHK